jgi:hypothetical protein
LFREKKFDAHSLDIRWGDTDKQPIPQNGSAIIGKIKRAMNRRSSTSLRLLTPAPLAITSRECGDCVHSFFLSPTKGGGGWRSSHHRKRSRPLCTSRVRRPQTSCPASKDIFVAFDSAKFIAPNTANFRGRRRRPSGKGGTEGRRVGNSWHGKGLKCAIGVRGALLELTNELKFSVLASCPRNSSPVAGIQ